MGSNFKQASLVAAIAAVISGQTFAEQAQDNKAQLEEIIVSGQKIERSLQDTKESVAIYTGDTIESLNITSISDIYQHTAGVSGDQFGFRIRGIGSAGAGRAELASVYVDGVGLTGWVKNEGPSQMWDVAQVEVLRGPQSTNLGRNALAGAIVVNTQDPVYSNEAKLRVGAGNYGSYEAKGVANISLVDGVSALRIAVEDSYSDGYVENITLGEKDFAKDENRTVRAKLLLEPSDDLKVILSLQQLDNSYGDSRVLLGGAGYAPEDQVSSSDQRGKYALEATLASLTLDYQLNDNWSVKSITASQDGERTRVSDYDQGPASPEEGGGVVRRYAEDTNLSQEVRFNFDSEQVRGSTGFYYGKSDSHNSNDTFLVLDLEQQINALVAPGIGTLLVNMGLYPQYFDLSTGGSNTVVNKNLAVFSEWEVDITSDWMISTGLRYNREEERYDLQNLGSSESIDLLPPPLTGDATLDYVITSVNAQLRALASNSELSATDTEFDAFLPHAGVTYQWNDDVATSFFIKQGYRSGGTDFTGLGEVNPYDSEYLLNYEFSLRSSVLDGKGTLNANAYYGDWTDQQVNMPEFEGTSAFFRVENAGKSKLAGVEAEFNYSVSDDLMVFASAALSKTEYKEFDSISGNYAGNQFSFAPEKTASLGAYQYFDGGFYLNSSLTYQGESYADAANNIQLDSVYLANLSGGYEGDNFKAELFVKNLFDKVYTTNEFGIRNQDNNELPFGRVGAPRTFGARATMSF